MARLRISSIMPALPIDPSPMDALARPLAVAVHDAGAANMIAAWAAHAAAPPDRVIAAGPGRVIWQQYFGDAVPIMADPAAIAGMATLVSGTGWASDLEHRARIAAAGQGVHCVAVIDHWVNYAMRFERAGARHWPDLVWVGDAEAAALARTALPGIAVEQHANTYHAQQADAAGPCPATGDALFVAEPARSDWGRERSGEFQALDFFMAQRGVLGMTAGTPVRIRPHPSDLPGKYEGWIAAQRESESGSAITIDTAPDMAAALRVARWVVGMNSAALVIALAAGRHVVSALPPHAPPCVLPHRGIVKLATL